MKNSNVILLASVASNRAAIQEETITYYFYGIDLSIRFDMWELYNHGLNIGEYLREYVGIPANDVAEILNRDYEAVDFDGELCNALYSNGKFTIKNLEAIEESLEYLSKEIVVAGLNLGYDGVQIEDSYVGYYESEVDFAHEMLDSGCLGDVPEQMLGYIDMEKLGRDLAFDYNILDGFWFSA